ncbi:hypothetical protein [Streptomyces sp. NPDC087300]|uniref:hypothetical protein n=1 Tax=Streptomyces sp. NPDC087300 TaxID=3365780 RepID=UPI003808D846
MSTTLFTFPSGASVELPLGLALCRDPDSGASPLPGSSAASTGHRCPAYQVAATVYARRRDVEMERRRASRYATAGRDVEARNIAGFARDAEERLEFTIGLWMTEDRGRCACTCAAGA